MVFLFPRMSDLENVQPKLLKRTEDFIVLHTHTDRVNGGPKR